MAKFPLYALSGYNKVLGIFYKLFVAGKAMGIIMAVGDRIKRVRQFRGLTQKELGKLVGFDEKTADIRIAQYESNTRKPKEDLLIKIAEALDVNFRSLYEPYNYAAEDVMFTLFDLDEHYRITIHDVPDEEYPDETHKAVQFNYFLLDEFF